MEFTNALIQGDLEAVRRCPKADLHNHFVLGGSREYFPEAFPVMRSVKREVSVYINLHSLICRGTVPVDVQFVDIGDIGIPFRVSMDVHQRPVSLSVPRLHLAENAVIHPGNYLAGQ